MKKRLAIFLSVITVSSALLSTVTGCGIKDTTESGTYRQYDSEKRKYC